MSISDSALFLADESSYQISRSLRFNSADSAYLSRTPGVAGNRKTWTWAGWVKRSGLGNAAFFSAISGGDYLILQFNTANTIGLEATLSVGSVNSASVYRDTSAWMHVVVAYDSTQATASNRVRFYVNGAETPYGSATYPTQNTDSFVNATGPHYVGSYDSLYRYFNGYLADIHFIDGQALTPSSFGAFDSNNVWQPKAYTGSYGTNGFKLDFSDNSAATATTLGADRSGNGNNWTPGNLSVTAGSGNDSLVDSPTNYGTDTGAGGEVRGNYATLNPLLTDTVTKSNGNLDFTTPVALTSSRATFGITGGKWYWEVVGTANGASGLYGIVKETALLTTYVGGDSSGWGYDGTTGQKFNNTTAAYGATYTTNDVIGVAFDADAGTLAFYKNGVTQGTAYTGLTSGPYFPAISDSTAASTLAGSINFGQRPFAYPAPSGYKALCSTNLPTPTILNGATAMDVKLYTGNGSSNVISGLGFSPDLVWIKSRSAGQDNTVYDIVRGVSERLETNNTDPRITGDTGVLSFDSTGFSLGSLLQVNQNTVTYATWCWEAGSSTVSNGAGTIGGQINANASTGFSILRYAGSSANGTLGHGLGVAPAFIIIKMRDSSGNWVVYHESLGNQAYIVLNSTAASVTGSNFWVSTSPTSTVFTVQGNATINGAGNYVAYCFAPVSGYSAFGSYTGNSSADGPFVYTGFRPRWVMIKNSSAVGSWLILDTARDIYNVSGLNLSPDASTAESTNDSRLDFLSSGFKIRNTYTNQNTSSNTYIYAAFAENPFSIARAR